MTVLAAVMVGGPQDGLTFAVPESPGRPGWPAAETWTFTGPRDPDRLVRNVSQGETWDKTVDEVKWRYVLVIDHDHADLEARPSCDSEGALRFAYEAWP